MLSRAINHYNSHILIIVNFLSKWLRSHAFKHSLTDHHFRASSRSNDESFYAYARSIKDLMCRMIIRLPWQLNVIMIILLICVFLVFAYVIILHILARMVTCVYWGWMIASCWVIDCLFLVDRSTDPYLEFSSF